MIPISAPGEDQNDHLTELETKIDSLRMAAKNTEALELAKQLLVLKKSNRQTKPYELSDANRLVETLEFLLSLSSQAQEEIAEADRLDSVVEEFWRKGQYEEAAEAREKQLEIRRKHLGLEHPDIARSLNNLASFQYRRGDYASAELLLREALAMKYKLLGEEHPGVAVSLNNLAALLYRKGDYAAAEPLYRKSLAMRRKLFGKEHSEVAVGLNNLAKLLYHTGNFTEAEPLLLEALAMRRKLLGDDNPSVANSLNELAAFKHLKGDHAGAEQPFKEALDIWRKSFGEEHPHVITCINNLAVVLKAQGDYAGAEPLTRETLAVRRKLLGDAHPHVALSLFSLASLLHAKEEYTEAEPLYKEALDIWRNSLGEEHPKVVNCLNDLAKLYRTQKKYAEAESLLTLAGRVYDVARLRAGTGLARATFLRSSYSILAATRLELGNPAEAWTAAEKDHGRALADLLFSADLQPLNPIETAREDSLRKILGDLERDLDAYRKAAQRDTTGEAIEQLEEVRNQLFATEAEWGDFQAEIAKKYPITAGQTYPLERVQEALNKETAFIGWLDVEEENEHYVSWAYVIRNKGPVSWVQLENSTEETTLSPFERVRLFRDVLVAPSRAALGVTSSAKRLWSERIGPLSTALEDTKHLIVIPSGAMLGIPIEALVDNEDVSVGKRFDVSYTPSATIYAWLQERSKERKKRNSSKNLLIGDPPFNPTHVTMMAQKDEPEIVQQSFLPDSATVRSALAGNDRALASLPRLPGTRHEVQAISTILPYSTLLLGLEATEEILVRMAESGQLREFTTIHLATHALVDDEQPEQSALVLSQVNLPDPLNAAMNGTRIYDGLVTAKEIVREWKLDADLVTLSACETGLGKKVGGEGYIGFSHAFLQAGARSLLVSLWKVEDQATSLLMYRFYENCHRVRTKGTWFRKRLMTKAEALQEAKLWLQNYTDKNGHKPYEHPYFWSAFILIGDRN